MKKKKRERGRGTDWERESEWERERKRERGPYDLNLSFAARVHFVSMYDDRKWKAKSEKK